MERANKHFLNIQHLPNDLFKCRKIFSDKQHSSGYYTNVSGIKPQTPRYIALHKKSPPFPKVIDITCFRDIFQFALVEDLSHA